MELTIQEMVEKARVAMDQIKDFTQEQVDQICYEAAKAVYKDRETLSEMAVEETRLGRVDHKIGKLELACSMMWEYLQDKPSVGVIAEHPELGITEVAKPVGVVACISPATNPGATPIANFMQAIKGKNAMIVSPAPRAKATSGRTVDLIREACVKCGAPADLIQCVENVSIEKSGQLMAAADLIVATGGAGMVKAAYSSGTPAYGVGPGNPPVILDRDFDIEEAVPIMAEASGFENGILCDGCNHFLYPVEKEAEVFEAWRKGNIVVFDKKEDVDKFREVMFPDGKANAEIIGHDADVIAKAAGFDVPKETEVIALKIDKIGAEEILTHEFLGPTMTMITYETFEEAVDKALKILTEQGGIGHGTGVLSHNEDHIRYVAEKIPVSRLMINQPSSDGWGPSHNGLPPTMSESCGTWGNNILAGNVDYIHFLNITRIARRLDKEWPDAEEMFK